MFVFILLGVAIGGVVALMVEECDMSLQGAHLYIIVCGMSAGGGVKTRCIL